MSKKASETERYDRKRKMEREAEIQKRKNSIQKKKGNRPKLTEYGYTKGHFYYDDEEYEIS
ncbi:MAG: hypothetical protein HFE57_02630 [Firmicutes bacterium]|nr:hypothetical protein [Bacillota bacterium]